MKSKIKIGIDVQEIPTKYMTLTISRFSEGFVLKHITHEGMDVEIRLGNHQPDGIDDITLPIHIFAIDFAEAIVSFGEEDDYRITNWADDKNWLNNVIALYTAVCRKRHAALVETVPGIIRETFAQYMIRTHHVSATAQSLVQELWGWK